MCNAIKDAYSHMLIFNVVDNEQSKYDFCFDGTIEPIIDPVNLHYALSSKLEGVLPDLQTVLERDVNLGRSGLFLSYLESARLLIKLSHQCIDSNESDLLSGLILSLIELTFHTSKPISSHLIKLFDLLDYGDIIPAIFVDIFDLISWEVDKLEKQSLLLTKDYANYCI